MNSPDFERAYSYVLKRLTRELSPLLTYHSVAHTRDDVVPTVARLAARLPLTAEERLLLYTAAWYHDIGFVERWDNHEAAGVEIARAVLPQYGYSDDQIQTVEGMILATRLPQQPQTLLEQILADADLDSLGRRDFLRTSFALRSELVVFGATMSDTEWYIRQHQFLRAHRYFTAPARQARDAQKRRNIAQLELLIQRQKATYSSEPSS